MKDENSKKNEYVKEDLGGLKLKKSEVWKYLSILFIILLIISVATSGFSFIGLFGSVSKDKAAETALDFINSNLLQAGTSATLNSVSEKNGLYYMNISITGKDYGSYVTKNGKVLFTNAGVDMTQKIEKATDNSAAQQPAEVTKSDKPNVELFVMTYCPYGTQAEKGLLPAISALKDKASVNIRFVHYFMHGDKEEQETYRQICIREEQKDKFISYLGCFLEAGDYAGCLNKTKVDTAKLDTCIKDKAKTYYAADSALSNKYGVSGSPTMVINGGQADFYPRSPDNALKTICSAFNKAPSECTQTLATDNPSPGFGYSATSAGGSEASCG